MKSALWIGSVVMILGLVATQAFAADCCAPAGGEATITLSTQAADKLPPVENRLQVTGTVVKVDATNGTALVDTGVARIYVITRAVPAPEGKLAPAPLHIGDKVILSGVLLALSVEPAELAAEAVQAAPPTTKTRFQVGNILCGACSNAVKVALQAEPGVKRANFVADGLVEVTYDAAVVAPDRLIGVIVAARHPHEGMHFTARVAAAGAE